MDKVIVPIKGMHCRSCEILVEEELKTIPEIKNAIVSFKKNQAELYYKGSLDMAKVEGAIESAGYNVGLDEKKEWISKDLNEYADLAISILVLLVLYMVARLIGLGNLSASSAGNPSGLLVVLGVGLTAGFSTCMALVGGLILGISARYGEKNPEATAIQKFRPHLFFNLGRILSYFILGGVIGLIGQAFQFSGVTLGLLTIFVGLIMLFLGVKLIEVFPRFSSSGFTLPSGIARFFGISGRKDKEYSHVNSMVVGALTFFLPCGFTQAMQLYAMSTGSFISGALIMGAFAIGTAPGLLSVGGITSLVKGWFAKKFFKFVGLVVIALALFNISNGYTLTGWPVPSFKSDTQVVENNNNEVEVSDGVQVVKMTQTSYGYEPNQFTIKKGVPVKWIITSQDANSCASSIYMPQMGVRQFLNPGENIVEFTPTDSGELRFSCSMGMYRGVFNVQ